MGNNYKDKREAARADHKDKEEHTGRYAHVVGTAGGTVFEWADVNPQVLASATSAVVAVGDAITFGRRRDGKALYLNIYSGGEKAEWYLRSVDEAEATLEGIIAAANGA